MRKAQESTAPYAQWLQQLRAVCTAHGIPLIFDEMYSGFRLGPGGAQEYCGVRADLVVHGKTVAGGMPIGVVCGTKCLMRRVDGAHPMRLAYVVGIFSAHPAVMGAMNEFLQWATEPGHGHPVREGQRDAYPAGHRVADVLPAGWPREALPSPATSGIVGASTEAVPLVRAAGWRAHEDHTGGDVSRGRRLATVDLRQDPDGRRPHRVG